MSVDREIIEQGPRLGVIAGPEERKKIREGLDAAGYERGDHPSTREERFRHPGGSVARLFVKTGHLYVYPPGGTKNQTGPLAPFSPLKRECAEANGRAGFGNAEADEAAGFSSDADHEGEAGPDDDDADQADLDHPTENGA